MSRAGRGSFEIISATRHILPTLKIKKRNRLHLENDLLICVLKTEPKFEKLLQNKQAQPFH
jgi:hypothetical protein